MAKKKKVYTSGTLYEQEIGRYADPGLYGDFARVNRNTVRKKNIADGTATVTKGAKVPAARRGVGQETVDGFINQNPKSVANIAMKNRKTPPRRKRK